MWDTEGSWLNGAVNGQGCQLSGSQLLGGSALHVGVEGAQDSCKKVLILPPGQTPRGSLCAPDQLRAQHPHSLCFIPAPRGGGHCLELGMKLRARLAPSWHRKGAAVPVFVVPELSWLCWVASEIGEFGTCGAWLHPRVVGAYRAHPEGLGYPTTLGLVAALCHGIPCHGAWWCCRGKERMIPPPSACSRSNTSTGRCIQRGREKGRGKGLSILLAQQTHPSLCS